jgi:hypothetical protein
MPVEEKCAIDILSQKETKAGVLITTPAFDRKSRIKKHKYRL